jgi:acyl-CoA synthetase (AMP-forming)/AMP-acid ligase II
VVQKGGRGRRAKDIIISGGENISSIEIETVLFSHPAVLDAAVVAKVRPTRLLVYTHSVCVCVWVRVCVWVGAGGGWIYTFGVWSQD